MALVARAPGYIPTYVRIDPPPPAGWAERVSLQLERQLPVKGVLAMPTRASRAKREVQFLLTSLVKRSEFHPEELRVSGLEAAESAAAAIVEQLAAEPQGPPWAGLLPDLESANSGTRWTAVTALGETSDVAVAEQAVPDFTLADVNPLSSSGGEGISPRDYLQQVSGWYFGHAT